MRKPVIAVVGGAFVVGCAVLASWATTVPGRAMRTDGAPIGWRYSPMTWALLLALAVAGTVMMSRSRWSRPAAVVAAIVGFQVAARALIMTSTWVHYHGTTGITPGQLARVLPYAALVAVAPMAATVAALAVVWREPSGWRSVLPARPGYVGLGAVVVLLLPVVWSAAHDNRVTVSSHLIWMYALPWGLGVAAMGWLRGRAATAAATAVLACVALYAVVALGDHALALLTPPPESD